MTTEAVKAGTTARAPRAGNPAKETAERRVAQIPERPEATPLSPEEEFRRDMKQMRPDLTDSEISYLFDIFHGNKSGRKLSER